jgi:glycogen debranching enzyme-like protein
MATTETTITWSGIGAPSRLSGIQSTTVNPDAQVATEGAPEWLVTNGLGGYASGTMSGLVTRRFHGYLIAALPAPRGRTMMFNHLRELLISDEGHLRLSEQPDPENTGAPIAKLAGPIVGEYALRVRGDRYEIENMVDVDLPPLRMNIVGADAQFQINARQIHNVRYLVEQEKIVCNSDKPAER